MSISKTCYRIYILVLLIYQQTSFSRRTPDLTADKLTSDALGPGHSKRLGDVDPPEKAAQIPREDGPHVVLWYDGPDIVLWSKGTQQVVLIDLTVPWEERLEVAYEHKLKKYQALILDSQQNGCKAWNLPVEVLVNCYQKTPYLPEDSIFTRRLHIYQNTSSRRDTL